MLNRNRGFRAAIVACVVALTAVACGNANDATTPATTSATTSDQDVTPRLSIVAATSILGSIVEDLVGDAADVTVLIGPGVDPHGDQASARDGQILRAADLVVANGPLDDVPLEEGLFDLLTTIRNEGVPVFDFVAAIDPLPFASPSGDDDDHGHDEEDDHGHDQEDDHGHDQEDDHGHDEEDDHGHGDLDPHFWWDLTRVATGVEQLARAIAAIDSHRTTAFWTERGVTAAQVYRELDADVQEQLAVLTDEQRIIVTNHESLGYFADRYGFTIVETVIPGASTQVETNPRDFAALIDLIVEQDITVIFAENTDSTRLAEQLATQAGARSLGEVTVVRLYTDALGPADSGADTYVSMVQTTVSLIVEALS